jgi:hypothetical protein
MPRIRRQVGLPGGHNRLLHQYNNLGMKIDRHRAITGPGITVSRRHGRCMAIHGHHDTHIPDIQAPTPGIPDHPGKGKAPVHPR